MLQLVVRVRTLLTSRQHEEGATAVEYGVMIGLIAAMIAGVVGVLGGKISTIFSAAAAIFSQA